MNDKPRSRNRSGHWRENWFDSLTEIGREAGQCPAWVAYSQFCAQLEQGLRKQALLTLNKFISRMESAEFPERKAFVSWLLGRIDQRAEKSILAPHPLQKRLIEPTLAEWAAAEPLCSEPHRWLGGCDDLRRALQLDSGDEIARRKLVSAIIRPIEYSCHELPHGYLGDAINDMTSLGEAEAAALQLANVEERRAAIAEIRQLEAEIGAWLRSRSIDDTKRVYEQPEMLSEEKLSRSLSSDDPMIVCDALISAALHDPNPLHVESLVILYLQHPNQAVRRVSATAAGHLARIHRHTTCQIVSLLETMLEDPQISGTARDALDDIQMFTNKPG
jgi:hypothetical protein